MLTDHAKLLCFFQEVKQVAGRKKLQKMIYILQVSGIPFEEKFHFHFYGPYSEELSLRVKELCNLGFIDEGKEVQINYTPYTYTITEPGQQFLHQFDLQMPDFSEEVCLLQSKSSRFLELVATMLYFRHFPKEDVEKKVSEVKAKQHYSVIEMDEAWKLIENICHN